MEPKTLANDVPIQCRSGVIGLEVKRDPNLRTPISGLPVRPKNAFGVAEPLKLWQVLPRMQDDGRSECSMRVLRNNPVSGRPRDAKPLRF